MQWCKLYRNYFSSLPIFSLKGKLSRILLIGIEAITAEDSESATDLDDLARLQTNKPSTQLQFWSLKIASIVNLSARVYFKGSDHKFS